MNKKLLAFDIDGTIVDSHGVLHPATIHALSLLRAQGHVVCYATSRRDYDMLRTPRLYDCADYAVLNTGTTIRKVSDGTLLFDKYTDPEASRLLVDTCLKNQWMLYVIYSDKFDVNIITEGVEDYIRLTGVTPPVYQSPEDISYRRLQGFMASRDRENIVSFIKENQLPFECIHSEPECYDITPAGMTKWSGIRRLAEHLNIQTADILTMGNWLNDYEMIVQAGTGIAVGDAIEDLKAAADYVTPHGHNDDAVLDICRHFFGMDI